ncbi:hypothetical protein CZ809_01216 [Photobacterium piscicola]|uniref:Toxin VasX N-terminal region domain-containing protein n=1 Tax=Photobacterium piscicola TaxID=1378299 RepID=A0A1T5HY29_9GAMM|nr:toxin VasX [Photobacterium piscicola]SKC31709.1 hypothetical protein CZ809_01216 [Photobacterium piscicola]
MSSDAYNAAEIGGSASPSSPAGACPLQATEVGIIPVRYAIDGSMGEKPSYSLPDGTHWKPTFKLHQHYMLRQLRDGWLYVFSEKLKVLHTYKIEGEIFTAQHDGGTCSSCLTYDSDDTLWLSYAHQAWTPRIVTLFSNEEKYRNKWMRPLNISAFKRRMNGPHAGMAKNLESSVADIGSVSQDIINGFSITSTPLKADTSTSEGEFSRTKTAITAPTYQAALPNANVNDGLFIALEDPLADITDIALKLGTFQAQKEYIFGSDTDKHKLLMSEFTRSIARVPYDPKTAPMALKSKLKDSPLETLKFEAALNEYLRYQFPLKQTPYGSEANAVNALSSETVRSAALNTLQNTYGYTPTDKDIEHFKSREKNIGEINWELMSTFLTNKYNDLDKLEGEAAPLIEDLDNALISLGEDALRVGIDIESEQGQSFLNQLFSQLFSLMTSVSKEWKAAQKQSLLALAPYYYSPEFQSVIHTQISNDAVSFSSSSDITNMASRVGESYGLLVDGRIPDTDDAIKATLVAAKSAFSKASSSAWKGLMDSLFPYHFSGKNGLASGLQLIVARSLVSKENKIQISSDYSTQLAKFNKTLTPFLQQAERQSGQLHSQNTTAMRNALAKTKQQIANHIAQEMPLLITFETEAMNTAVREKLTASIVGLRSRIGQSMESINGAGTVIGGFAAICNLWNLSVVSKQVVSKLNSASSTQEQADVYIELASTISWTLSAFAGVGRDAQVIPKTLIEKSVREAIGSASNIEQQVVIKRFVAAAKVTAIFGLFAASSEAYLTVKQIQKSDDFFEQIILTSKGLALGLQGYVSGYQLVNFVRGAVLSEIVAAWMISALFYAGIAYLIFSGLYNYFHRNEMQKWLQGSTWGNSPKTQTPEQELMELENIIWKPKIELTKKNVDIYLPSYLFDDEKQHYDLQIVVQKKSKNINLSYAPPHVIQEEMNKPRKVMIDVSQAKRKKTANGVSYIAVPVTHDEGDTVVIAINYDRAWTHNCQSYAGRLNKTGTFDLEKTKDVIIAPNGVAGIKLPTTGETNENTR